MGTHGPSSFLMVTLTGTKYMMVHDENSHGILRVLLTSHAVPWGLMGSYGFSSIDSHGFAWGLMGSHGLSWNLIMLRPRETPEKPIRALREMRKNIIRPILIGLHRVSWDFMGSHWVSLGLMRSSHGVS